MRVPREQLILFSADSLDFANPSAWLVSRKDRTTIDTFGLSFRDWSKKLDLVGSFVRMSLESSASQQTMYAPIWSVSATTSGFGILKLYLSERRNGEHESFLWPTPNAKTFEGMNQSGDGRRKPNKLSWAASIYPTPRTCSGKRSSGMNRTEYYRLWATPSAADAKGSTGGGQGRSLRTDVHLFPTPRASDGICGALRDPEKVNPKRYRLEDHVALFPTPTANVAKNNGSLSQRNRKTPPLDAVVGGSLNPDWVEWLQGFPLGWTALDGGEKSLTFQESPVECPTESKG